MHASKPWTCGPAENSSVGYVSPGSVFRLSVYVFALHQAVLPEAATAAVIDNNDVLLGSRNVKWTSGKCIL